MGVEAYGLDLVVVVPGIMGSELVDQGGRVLWGQRASVVAQALMHGELDALHVTVADLTRAGRIQAPRLVRRPAWLPLWGGLEPYKALVDHLRREYDRRSVVEFPYDWRLPVDVSGQLLADFCVRQLEDWTRVVTREKLGDPRSVRVTLVAHSMGGLVARYASEVFGARALLRRIVTLATPHLGSAKALQMVAGDRYTVAVPLLGDVGLPRRLQQAIQSLAVTCPSVYDLLPRYRCVVDPTSEGGVRRLSVDDIVAAGGNRDLAVAAQERAARLEAALTEQGSEPAPVTALAGSFQPTLQNVTVDAGACQFHYSPDVGGDATVLRRAAKPAEVTEASPLPQRHGALAKSVEARTFVLDRLMGADQGLPLGTGPVSVDIPSVAAAGAATAVSVQPADAGATLSANGVSVTSENLDTSSSKVWRLGPSDATSLRFHHHGLEPGMHRVVVSAGGFSPVSEIIFVTTNHPV